MRYPVTIDGHTYSSLEEMPPEVRRQYAAASYSTPGTITKITHVTVNANPIPGAPIASASRDFKPSWADETWTIALRPRSMHVDDSPGFLRIRWRWFGDDPVW